MIIEEQGGIDMMKVYFTGIWWVGVLGAVVVELRGEFRITRTSSMELKLQCKLIPMRPFAELQQAAIRRSAANCRRSLLLWNRRKSALPHAGRNGRGAL
jgi:hypothetical protein